MMGAPPNEKGSVMDRIVVGVDGSPPSNAALAWAAHHAARLGLPIEAVTVWHPSADVLVSPISGVDMTAGVEEVNAREASKHALERLGDVGVHIEPIVAEGRPADVLDEVAGEDALVVVGAHSGDGLRKHLGSTANRIALHHHGPVAVIPAETQPGSKAPVVVGVDGSDHSVATLCWAVSFAPDDREIHAVHGYSFPPPTPAYATIDIDPTLIEESAANVLAGAVGQAEARCGGRAISQKVGAGDPRRVLEHAAEQASLLVVGAKGHSVFLHRAFGSVVTYLLSRHPCPIVVVPEEVTEP